MLTARIPNFCVTNALHSCYNEKYSQKVYSQTKFTSWYGHWTWIYTAYIRKLSSDAIKYK